MVVTVCVCEGGRGLNPEKKIEKKKIFALDIKKNNCSTCTDIDTK